MPLIESQKLLTEADAIRSIELMMSAIQSLHEKIDKLEGNQLEFIHIFELAASKLTEFEQC